jgi:sec-independent protein translocase protein TatC
LGVNPGAGDSAPAGAQGTKSGGEDIVGRDIAGGDPFDPDRFTPMTSEEMEAELDAIEAEEEADSQEIDSEEIDEPDPVEQKLARIKVLRDREDYAGARRLLYEVLEDGDDEQRFVARDILAQLDES